MTLGTAGYTLLLFNFMIFATGLAFAYYRHDPHPDYERAVKDRDKYQNQIDRARADFEKRSSAIDKKYAGDLSFLDQRIDQVEAQISETAAHMSNVRDSASEAVGLVRTVVRQKILAYQAGVEETRKENSRLPSYFGNMTVEKINIMITFDE